MHHLIPKQLVQLKQKLIDEKMRLERELSTVGIKNPAQPDDWTPVTDEVDGVREADPNDAADAVEDLEENTALVEELEPRLKDVSEALAKMDAGAYGIDENTGEPIDPDRLMANPAARTNVH